MAQTATVFSTAKGLGVMPLQATGTLFRGLTLAFLGFDAESLHEAAATAAATAAAAAADSNANAVSASGSASKAARQASDCGGARADAVAAHVLLQEMQEKAAAEGARVIEASREGVAAAGLLVCNFAAAFAHLRRFTDQQQCIPDVHSEPQHLVAALGLETLRLLSPFWLFACLRDRRVYAPDAHPLFRVSAALTHTQPPLLLLQQPLQHQQHAQPLRRKQRVLLLGCTRRLRRVRRATGFGCSAFASDSDEGSDGGVTASAAGHALAMHDAEIVGACVAALGGCCVAAAELKRVGEAGRTATGSTPSTSDDSGVDVVVVGHLPGLYKRGAALDAGEGARPTPGRPPPSPAEKKATTAAAELALLQRLQGRGVACVRLQWLLDAYRFGQAPRHEIYALPLQQSQQRQNLPVVPTAAALRKEVLHGVQLLVSDVAVTRDRALLQRIVDLGCTDVTAIPSLLGVCPWLFRCSTTQQLAAVICGSRDRVQVVDAALQRAEGARQLVSDDPAPVLLVLQREEMAGLLDLAAVAAETVEATASVQQPVGRRGASSGRGGSSRDASSQRGPSSQQRHQQQKMARLTAAAQQRVMQCLQPAAAVEAQHQWESATKIAATSVAPVDDLAAFTAQRNATAVAGPRPLVVSPEWIVRCWEEARRLPLDSAHGRIEVPDFWTEGVSSESTSHWEDIALTTALKHCGGAVVYGDFPVMADAKEARLRRALGALEHALSVSWDIQQQHSASPGFQGDQLSS